MTTAGWLGFLTGPPLIGFTAEWTSLRIGTGRRRRPECDRRLARACGRADNRRRIRMRRVLMFLLASVALAAPVVRGVRIDRPKGSESGRLLVMVGDRELAAAGEALRAWPAMNDTAVLYTRRGSYPDQQQLRLFDAPATVSRTLATVPGTILEVMQDVQPPDRWIFVLSIKDEGTGVPSLAVVGAEGGILYREILAVPGTLSGRAAFRAPLHPRRNRPRPRRSCEGAACLYRSDRPRDNTGSKFGGNEMKHLLLATAAAFVLAAAPAHASGTWSTLAGEWQFALDPANEGVQKKWFERSLEDRIALPGTTDENRKGDSESCAGPGPVDASLSVSRRRLVSTRHRRARRLERQAHRAGARAYEIEPPLGGRPRRSARRTRSSPRMNTELQAIAAGRHRLTLRIDNAEHAPIGDPHQISDHTQTNWNGVIGRLDCA